MKHNPLIGSTLRRPLRSLLFVLIIAAASFAFVARAAEYLVVEQGTQRLKAFYRPIGYLKPEMVDAMNEEIPNYTEDGWLMDVTQGVSVVTGSPHVDWWDQRRYCSGVLQGMQNSELNAFTSDSLNACYFNKPYGVDGIGLHVSDVVFSGTLVAKGEPTETIPFLPSLPLDGDWYVHEFLLQAEEVAVGYRDYVQEGTQVPLLLITQHPEEIETAYASVQEGTQYLVKAQAEPAIDSSWWNTDGEQMALRLKAIDGQGLYFYPMAPGTTIDWKTPALQGLHREVEVQRENQSAMAVIGTKDMSELPRMQETEAYQDYMLIHGRWLDEQDDLQSRRVCVVHKDFAALRGLSVGDTLCLNLRDLKAPLLASRSNYKSDKDRGLLQEAYILEGTEDWDHWREYPTQLEDFEIVGLYGTNMDPTNVPYGYGTIVLFIPDSCMPEGYGQEKQIHMDSFSFRLRSAEDTEAFLQEVEGPLADLGLKVELIDKGWENFAASARPIQRSTTLNAGVFFTVLVLVFALFAFLYLRQKRNEFAIQRALGVPRRAAVRQFLAPVALLGTLGVAAGGISAWRFALGKAGQTLAALQNAEGIEAVPSLSIWWLLGLGMAAMTILLGFAAVGAQMLARRPVLDLLQGEGARQMRRGNRPDYGIANQTQETRLQRAKGKGKGIEQAPVQDAHPGLIPQDTPSLSQTLGLYFRYTFRHIGRTPLKSLLSLALALCFLVALGWMSWTIERNEAEVDRLYRTTQVTGKVVQGPAFDYHEVQKCGGAYISNGVVDTIMQSGLVRDAYLEAGNVMALVPLDTEGGADYGRRASNLWLRAFDQPEVFFAMGESQNIEVNYAPGWDEEMFTTDKKAIILPDGLLSQLKVTVGQEVILLEKDGRVRGEFVIAGQYAGHIRVASENGPVILLPFATMKELEGNRLLYTAAEFQFDPAKNREMAGFRAVMNRMNLSYQSVQCQLKDEVLREVVEPLEKNLSLMAVLYPVTIGVSTLIGLGLALLLVIQSAREAAILRVLGTPRGKTCAMLGGGQTLLCLVGLLLGMSVLILLRREVGAVLGGPSLLCAGLYLADSLCGTVIGAAYVTKDKALALLQVKE